LSILTSSNEKKTQNYKVVDLIKGYNFHIKFIVWRSYDFSNVLSYHATLRARQNNTVTPAGVTWQRFSHRKRRLTWRILSRQYMWHDSVIWSHQHHWRDQKGQIWKYFLGEIIFEILNKKILKYKNPPFEDATCVCVVHIKITSISRIIHMTSTASQ
jgi:hypothetical protein